MTVCIPDQQLRLPILDNPSPIHDDDPIKIPRHVQWMRDHDGRILLKLVPNNPLRNPLRLLIHARADFAKNKPIPVHSGNGVH